MKFYCLIILYLQVLVPRVSGEAGVAGGSAVCPVVREGRGPGPGC